MPWFKVDDKFHSHPKVMELTPSAVGLWTLAGAWCADYLTDGAIRSGQIRRLGGSEDEAQQLVDAGLWIATDEGWQFSDWTEYQPTREAVESERKAKKEAGEERAHQRWHVGRGVTSPDCILCRDSSPIAGAIAEPKLTDTPVPVPVPTNNTPSSESFDAWWATYPKKVDKGQARKAFKAALKKASLDELVDGAQHYATHVKSQGTEKRFIKNPSTWLNAEAWANEDTTTPPQKSYIWD